MEKKGSVRSKGPDVEKVQEIDLKHGGMEKKQEVGVDRKQCGETALTANEVRGVSTKGSKKSKDKLGKKKKKSDMKEKTRWEVAPEYFQFLALHWHTVATAHPGLDGSQVQGKIWKKWVRGETPKPLRPKVKDVRTKDSVEVTMRALHADGFL